MRPTLRPPWPKYTCLLRWHPRAPQSIPRRIATTSSTNPAPIDIPKLIVSPGSPHHNSLSSFLDYAKRTSLGPTTTYFVGTHYEYTSALSLMRLGFSLLRVGRASDAGIDLIGHWALAPLREPMRTIIQCKARNISVSPSNVRELEGAFLGIPPDWRSKDVLGLLVTTQKATRGTLEALGQSRSPMGFVMICKSGIVQQFVWNRAAAERGLEGVGVTLRHTPRVLIPDTHEEDIKPRKITKKSLLKFKNAGTQKDIQLTWMGSPIFADRDTIDQDTLDLLKVIQTASQTDDKKMVDTPIFKPNSKVLRTAHLPPTPRGGLVMGERPPKVKGIIGRPKGAKNKPKPKPARPKVSKTKLKRGRPEGSKNMPTRGRSDGSKNKLPPGRPKGSKNKPKLDIDAG
jgi:hypothetical protein